MVETTYTKPSFKYNFGGRLTRVFEMQFCNQNFAIQVYYHTTVIGRILINLK